MKKLIALVLVVVCVAAKAACGNQTKVKQRWECTIICAEESSDDAYVISYWDEKIISTTGILTADNNKNDFDIVVHLIADGEERVEEIGAGVICSLYQLARDTEYTVGCHADVPEGTEIIIPIYDGAGNVLPD